MIKVSKKIKQILDFFQHGLPIFCIVKDDAPDGMAKKKLRKQDKDGSSKGISSHQEFKNIN